MLIALLADIHSNLEALEACLADASRRGAGRHVFLGDVVGYGADPVACCERVMQFVADGAPCVLGNHDAAIDTPRDRMNDVATAAIEWTRRQLSPEQRAFLANLPLTATQDDRLYVHASAADPGAFSYVADAGDAAKTFMATKARVIVCGHIHKPALYHASVTGKIMGFAPVTAAPVPLLTQRRWLAVLGAVGQPRDQNPAAAYAILDTAVNAITYHRVPYDIAAAQAKIRAAGLPDFLASRLAEGR
jgi:diadenosine tetraphosphatase ApaH/serine/threonine PP2A family protein phosphatase